MTNVGGGAQSTLGSDIPGVAALEKVRKVVVLEPGEQSIKEHFSLLCFGSRLLVHVLLEFLPQFSQ